MSKVVIGIHGLGNKPAKDVLENWWILSMKEGLKGIGKRQTLPKFEMVYWADLFYDAPLDERIGDSKDPCYLDEPYRVAPKSLRHETNPTRLKVIDFIGQKINRLFLTPSFNLKYSFITDSITEKYFHELGEYFKVTDENSETESSNVRQQIVKRVIDTINKYTGDDIFIVAHSMGSIIAYDVLAHALPSANIKVLATIGSPLGMPNVLGELAEIKRRMGVAEITMNTPDSVKFSWCNFSDIDDKVAFNYKLSDDYGENTLGLKPVDFQIFNNYVINGERNPHKSFGYLRAPEFANVLAQFVESKQSISQWFRSNLLRILRGLKLKRNIS